MSVCFNRINSGRSIPTMTAKTLADIVNAPFQSYQFRQINPDLVKRQKTSLKEGVSIVSIQADQSRLGTSYRRKKMFDSGFQSYQFRQINPDEIHQFSAICMDLVSIVSIQADQSRPDAKFYALIGGAPVSIVSIQADQSRL